MTGDRRAIPFVALLGVSLGALVVHAILALNLGEGYAIPVTIIGAIGATVVLRGPLGQAIAERIRGGAGSELPPEQVLNELDELRSRLNELEERTDFSERMLAQRREGDPERP
jgi:hypothetical protein